MRWRAPTARTRGWSNRIKIDEDALGDCGRTAVKTGRSRANENIRPPTGFDDLGWQFGRALLCWLGYRKLNAGSLRRARPVGALSRTAPEPGFVIAKGDLRILSAMMRSASAAARGYRHRLRR
jgi:hypothetical protein